MGVMKAVTVRARRSAWPMLSVRGKQHVLDMQYNE